MHYFSNFILVQNSTFLDMFTVHHQASNTVYTTIGICHTSYADCVLARSG